MTDPTPKTEESKGNLPDNVTKVLEEIKAKLENPPAPREETPAPPAGPNAAEQREGLKKSLGYSEEQMQAHEQMLLRSQAPVIERLGWQTLEKKADLETYKKEIESEMSLYPQERRTPEIMEKIYFMVKGRHADSRPAAAPKGDSPRVTETRVSRGPGYSGSEPGLSGAGAPSDDPNDPNKLTDEEKFVANKLGVGLKEYAQSKAAGRSIRELRVPDSRQAQSMADVELKRLMGR